MDKMPRVYLFKGKSSEELAEMSVKAFSALLTSRQRRSLLNPSTEYKKLIEKAAEFKKAGKSGSIKTHVREAVIIPSWIGMHFSVHNGKEFKEFEIKAEMAGRRLGEFSFTTKKVAHSAPGIRATRGSKFLAVK